jgi:hypothetical protein
MADTKNYQSTSGSSTDARSDPFPASGGFPAEGGCDLQLRSLSISLGGFVFQDLETNETSRGSHWLAAAGHESISQAQHLGAIVTAGCLR